LDKEAPIELKITLNFRNKEDKNNIRKEIDDLIEKNRGIKKWLILDEGLREGGSRTP